MQQPPDARKSGSDNVLFLTGFEQNIMISNMEEIKSILKGSNGLQRISQLTGATNIVSGEIRSRLRHLNQSVDRKVEDLYHNIIGNFSRTVLPATNPRTDELQPARICVDGSKSGGKSCRELIPLRKKKQMDEVVNVRQ